MTLYQQTAAMDGRPLLLRSGTPEDAPAYLAYYTAAHSETEYLTTYPDENRQDTSAMAQRLAETAASSTAIEICAFVGGELVGSAGIGMVRDREKTRHRATFGISIRKEYWGLGIGTVLTAACIAAARQAGYLQLELEVVAENQAALRLYRRLGFLEYGRNPKAFRTRAGRWQETALMRLEL